MDEKKITNQIIITVFDDNTMAVKAPQDFLLFRDILCLAERTVINQKRTEHEKQDKIITPNLSDIMDTVKLGREQ